MHLQQYDENHLFILQQ